MKRILLALKENEPDMNAVDFAAWLANQSRSKLTAIMLGSNVKKRIPVLAGEANGAEQSAGSNLSAEDYFSNQCEHKGVRSEIIYGEGRPLQDILKASRFSDLIVLNAQTSFSEMFEGTPTDFAKQVLEESECPVFIVPRHCEPLEEIVFAYSDSRSCVFAMKQFTYLFPEFDELKVMVLHVNEGKSWTQDDKHAIRDWLQNHYSAIGFESAEGDAASGLLRRLFDRKNACVVMGAYGRNAISRSFKKSNADMLVQITAQPVFITHI